MCCLGGRQGSAALWRAVGAWLVGLVTCERGFVVCSGGPGDHSSEVKGLPPTWLFPAVRSVQAVPGDWRHPSKYACCILWEAGVSLTEEPSQSLGLHPLRG